MMSVFSPLRTAGSLETQSLRRGFWPGIEASCFWLQANQISFPKSAPQFRAQLVIHPPQVPKNAPGPFSPEIRAQLVCLPARRIRRNLLSVHDMSREGQVSAQGVRSWVPTYPGVNHCESRDRLRGGDTIDAFCQLPSRQLQ